MRGVEVMQGVMSKDYVRDSRAGVMSRGTWRLCKGLCRGMQELCRGAMKSCVGVVCVI